VETEDNSCLRTSNELAPVYAVFASSSCSLLADADADVSGQGIHRNAMRLSWLTYGQHGRDGAGTLRS
jgi:hypothetical protein